MEIADGEYGYGLYHFERMMRAGIGGRAAGRCDALRRIQWAVSRGRPMSKHDDAAFHALRPASAPARRSGLQAAYGIWSISSTTSDRADAVRWSGRAGQTGTCAPIRTGPESA